MCERTICSEEGCIVDACGGHIQCVVSADVMAVLPKGEVVLDLVFFRGILVIACKSGKVFLWNGKELQEL